MADAVIKYARQHGKLIASIIAAVFAIGGMFATARADMEHIKQSNEVHEKRLGLVERESVSASTKLDGIAEDVAIIKKHLIGEH